jgi:hypothetical protein
MNLLYELKRIIKEAEVSTASKSQDTEIVERGATERAQNLPLHYILKWQ